MFNWLFNKKKDPQAEFSATIESLEVIHEHSKHSSACMELIREQNDFIKKLLDENNRMIAELDRLKELGRVE
jgi:hypothetical protein